MKTLFASCLLAGAMIVSLAATAPAQDTSATNQNPYNTATDDTVYNSGSGAPTPNTGNQASNTATSKLRTLSGCLQRGAGANEYTLYGYNANSWEVVSNTVDLAAHVGQAVEITYISQPADSNYGGSRPLVVSNVGMLSSSCSW